MCLILAKQVNGVLQDEWIRDSWRMNSDGAGFMFVKDDEVIVYKGFMELDSFLSALYNAINMYPDSPFVVHLRSSTGGRLNSENCHPFVVNKHVAFAHNGILVNHRSDLLHSDTYYFNEKIVKPIAGDGYDFLDNTAITFLLNSYCGASNKLAFLDSSKRICIINHEAGEWTEDKQVWSSSKWTFYGWDSKVSYGDYENWNTYPYLTGPSHQLPPTANSTSKADNNNLIYCDVCGGAGNRLVIESYEGWNVCWTCADLIFKETVQCTCGKTYTPGYSNTPCPYCGHIYSEDELITLAMEG